MSTHVNIIFLFIIRAVTADVQVYFTSEIGQMVEDFQDMPATFGEPIPSKGIAALVVYANPELACGGRIDPPPQNVTNFTKHWAVLIKRCNCTFEDKIIAAQNANYNIAIIHNKDSNDLERMHVSHPSRIHIPSVFVGETTGLIIKERYLYDKGFLIRISEDSPLDFNTSMLIPFLVVVSVCLLTMLGFLVVKYIKDCRRAGRRRLPNSSLRKIPIVKYKKGDPYETCAICLDDYVEGEKLRILPCSHAYHSKCIDPWLTKNKRICPMCKRKVYAAGERVPSDSDSASEDDDQTPLLRTAQQTHGGTFTSVFVAALVASRAEAINNSDDQDDSSSVSSFPNGSIESNRNRIGHHSNSASTTQSGRSPSRSALNGSSEDVNPFHTLTHNTDDVSSVRSIVNLTDDHRVVI